MASLHLAGGQCCEASFDYGTTRLSYSSAESLTYKSRGWGFCSCDGVCGYVSRKGNILLIFRVRRSKFGGYCLMDGRYNRGDLFRSPYFSSVSWSADWDVGFYFV